MNLIMHLPTDVSTTGTGVLPSAIRQNRDFHTRELVIQNVTKFRYVQDRYTESSYKVFQITLEAPSGSEADTDALYNQVMQQTGWKKTVDWNDKECLFAHGGEVFGEFGIIAAGEFWLSYELVEAAVQ